MTETRARDGFTLCSRCALCCDGSLFGDVRLEAGEVETAQKLHLPLVTKETHLSFRQPCPKLRADATCSIYEERPQACRGFVCHTLSAYQAGEIDLPAAEARVRRLRAAAARVVASLPEGLAEQGLWRGAEMFSEQGESAPDRAAWRAEHGALLLDILELELLCRRDFTTRDKGG